MRSIVFWGMPKSLCGYALTYMDVLKQEKPLAGYIVGFLARSVSFYNVRLVKTM